MGKSFLNPPHSQTFFNRPPPRRYDKGLVGLYQAQENEKTLAAVCLFYWEGGPNPLQASHAVVVRKYAFVNDAMAGWSMLCNGATLEQVESVQHGPCEARPKETLVGARKRRAASRGRIDQLSWL